MTRYFEGCLPIEEMADRGEDNCVSARSSPWDYAIREPARRRTRSCSCARKTSAGTAFNLVGFQTRHHVAGAKEAFGRRYRVWRAPSGCGRRHASQYVRGFAARLRRAPAVYFGAPVVFLAGEIRCRRLRRSRRLRRHDRHSCRSRDSGLDPIVFPRESAFGAVVAFQNTETPDFQPANVTWAPFPPLDPAAVGRDKRARRRAMADRALASIDALVASLVTPSRSPSLG